MMKFIKSGNHSEAKFNYVNLNLVRYVEITMNQKDIYTNDDIYWIIKLYFSEGHIVTMGKFSTPEAAETYFEKLLKDAKENN
jgi:hypothetical protein